MNARSAIDTLKFMSYLALIGAALLGFGLWFAGRTWVAIIEGLLVMLMGTCFWSLFYVVALIGEKVLLEPVAQEEVQPGPILYRAPVTE